MLRSFEECEGIEVTRDEAIREVELHDCDPNEFLAECGNHATYDAQAVLIWLGY